MGRILQAIRRILGGMVFLLLLLYACGVVSETYVFSASFLSHNQLAPALLAGSFGSVAVILLFTLLFGRWYCSCLCPLGILQDGIGRLQKRKLKFNTIGIVSTGVRCIVLVLCLVTYFSGTTVLLVIVEPWSVFGRLTTTFCLPVMTFCNNLLASVFNPIGNYTFVAKGYHIAGISVLFTAALSMFLLALFTLRSHGRFWCNTICPVGTVLSTIAKKSPLRIRIDPNKCISCGLCEEACKVGVINVERDEKVDNGNCIACFNCLPVCPHNAISYTFFTKGTTK